VEAIIAFGLFLTVVFGHQEIRQLEAENKQQAGTIELLIERHEALATLAGDNHKRFFKLSGSHAALAGRDFAVDEKHELELKAIRLRINTLSTHTHDVAHTHDHTHDVESE